MLNIAGENGVEDPVESNDHIHYHCHIVDPDSAERKHLSQKWVSGVCVTQTPVHYQVPHGCVDSVQECESNEGGLEPGLPFDTVHAESCIVQDTEDVLAQIQKMREGILRVHISTDTLEGSPDCREACEKSEKSRVTRVALNWVVPCTSIQTEKQFDVL